MNVSFCKKMYEEVNLKKIHTPFSSIKIKIKKYNNSNNNNNNNNTYGLLARHQTICVEQQNLQCKVMAHARLMS
jgi:hypothetical protein